MSTPSLPSLPRPLWPKEVAPDRVLYMGQIELKFVFMLNLTAWNRTVLKCKMCIHTKMNWYQTGKSSYCQDIQQTQITDL